MTQVGSGIRNCHDINAQSIVEATFRTREQPHAEAAIEDLRIYESAQRCNSFFTSLEFSTNLTPQQVMDAMGAAGAEDREPTLDEWHRVQWHLWQFCVHVKGFPILGVPADDVHKALHHESYGGIPYDHIRDGDYTEMFLGLVQSPHVRPQFLAAVEAHGPATREQVLKAFEHEADPIIFEWWEEAPWVTGTEPKFERPIVLDSTPYFDDGQARDLLA